MDTLISARVSLLPRQSGRTLSAQTTLVIDLLVGDVLQTTVDRTVSIFEELCERIRASHVGVSLEAASSRRVEDIERTLNSIFVALGDNIWFDKDIQYFIDNDTKVSPLAEKRIAGLAEEIAELQQQVEYLENGIALTKETISRMAPAPNGVAETLSSALPASPVKRDLRKERKLRRGSSSLTTLPEVDNEEEEEEDEEEEEAQEGEGEDEELLSPPVPLRLLSRSCKPHSEEDLTVVEVSERDAPPAPRSLTSLFGKVQDKDKEKDNKPPLRREGSLRRGSSSSLSQGTAFADDLTDSETVHSTTRGEARREGSLRRGSSSTLSYAASSVSSLPHLDLGEDCAAATAAEEEPPPPLPRDEKTESESGESEKKSARERERESDALPQSPSLPVELLRAVLVTPCAYEPRVDELVVSLSLSPRAAAAHRLRVAFLAEQLAKHCGVWQVFDLSLHCVACALAEDELRLLCVPAAVVPAPSPSQSGGGGATAAEVTERAIQNHLRTLAATSAAQQSQSQSQRERDRDRERDDEQEDVCAIAFYPQHQKSGAVSGTIGGVAFSLTVLAVERKREEEEQEKKDCGEKRESDALRLLAPSHAEAALLLLLDEFNALVGKNALFQRALTLLRSWWHCESVLYVGATIKHYLPATAFVLLVVSLFNKYHARIDTPFQALCLFFAEYSTLRASEQFCTVRGVADSAQGVAPRGGGGAAEAALLVDQQFFDKYKSLLPLSLSDTCLSPDTRITAGMYLVHPLTGENMLRERLTANQVIRFSKALQNGAASLAVFIRQLRGSSSPSLSPSQRERERERPVDGDLIRNFFPNIVSAQLAKKENSSELFAGTGGALDANLSPILGTHNERRASLLLCVHTHSLLCSGSLGQDATLCVVSGMLRCSGAMAVRDVALSLWHSLSRAARPRFAHALFALLDGGVCERSPEEESGSDTLSLLYALLLNTFQSQQERFIVVEESEVFVLLRESVSAQQLLLASRGLTPPSSLIKYSQANALAKSVSPSHADNPHSHSHTHKAPSLSHAPTQRRRHTPGRGHTHTVHNNYHNNSPSIPHKHIRISSQPYHTTQQNIYHIDSTHSPTHSHVFGQHPLHTHNAVRTLSHNAFSHAERESSLLAPTHSQHTLSHNALSHSSYAPHNAHTYHTQTTRMSAPPPSHNNVRSSHDFFSPSLSSSAQSHQAPFLSARSHNAHELLSSWAAPPLSLSHSHSDAPLSLSEHAQSHWLDSFLQ